MTKNIGTRKQELKDGSDMTLGRGGHTSSCTLTLMMDVRLTQRATTFLIKSQSQPLLAIREDKKSKHNQSLV